MLLEMKQCGLQGGSEREHAPGVSLWYRSGDSRGCAVDVLIVSEVPVLI